MTPRLQSWSDTAAQAWRNGGGVTRELLAWPPGDAWQVRISVADIASDGPFSAFPGVQRWFAVVQGAGVQLTVDGQSHRVGRGDAPLSFAGQARTECRLLDGPTRDLNLMLRRASGSLVPAMAGQAWAPPSAQCGLFSAVAGRCRSGALVTSVPALALLWFDTAPERLSFDTDVPSTGPIGWWLSATPQETRT